MGTNGGTVKGNIAMSGYRVTNLGTPVDAGDAVPKGYMTKANLGLEKVDNTQDSEKSVSHAKTADSATTAQSAVKAQSATTAESANSAKTATTANTAGKLATPVTVQVNLASGQAANFDGSANAKPGVTGVLPLKNGGHGASNGSEGLKNLLAAGPMVLSSYQYGDTLPAPGTPGRIFFLKVSD
jgi:cytoskeletal protein RodZ